ncbi:rhomboid family intramembrane serine protease [Xanthovirga aplysinae]|uniref:rhomboid family intramembrane serine protease n=1 Tax=Xanthovirga aplysinae TaxID=2529853 RepID=UPI0012BBB859|nr:rhomboid family intramembrane serine protease [Xanthovirga aplysinae]MTI29590.1 rhomboid family intramembrane serine protease [Xanthovirga aplysinae]
MNSLLEEFKSAFKKRDNSLIQLILINIAVFVVLGVLGVLSIPMGFSPLMESINRQLAIPSNFSLFLSRPWTIITYAFMHAGILHIFFNMLVMYWFGKLLMEYIGSRKLLSLYILGALAGGVIYLLVYNFVPYYAGINSQMVGASAAVYAIVVAAATLLPDYTFFLLFIGPVRLKYIAAIYILISLLGTAGANAGGNIAHLGGALIGYLYVSQMRKGIDLGKPVLKIIAFFKNLDLFKKKSKIKVTYHRTNTSQSSAPKSKMSKTEQAEIDAILDKISASGYESLSKEEKQKLFNASKK